MDYLRGWWRNACGALRHHAIQRAAHSRAATRDLELRLVLLKPRHVSRLRHGCVMHEYIAQALEHTPTFAPPVQVMHCRRYAYRHESWLWRDLDLSSRNEPQLQHSRKSAGLPVWRSAQLVRRQHDQVRCYPGRPIKSTSQPANAIRVLTHGLAARSARSSTLSSPVMKPRTYLITWKAAQ